MVFTWIDWNAVEVTWVGVKSDTTKTESPCFTIPFIFMRSMVFDTLASMSSNKSTRRGITPHCKFKAIRVLSSFVNANMGGYGRLRDRRDAICPCFVYTKMASTPRLLAAAKKPKHLCEGLCAKSVKMVFLFYDWWKSWLQEMKQTVHRFVCKHLHKQCNYCTKTNINY